MWAFFFCRQDVSITFFGRTKEFSKVCGTSLMCDFGVRSQFLYVIYGVRLPNGSPAKVREKRMENEKNPGQKIVWEFHFQSEKFRKNEKSQGIF